MPVYNVEAPDGKVLKLEGPEGASEQDILNAAATLYQQQAQPQPEIPQEASEDSSDFIRGIKSYIPQTKELFGGTKVLAGKMFNNDELIQSGVATMKEAQQEQIPLSKTTDSFTTALDKGLFTVLTDYVPYVAGQGVAMLSEAGLSALVGGLIGSAAGPGGTVTGGFSGIVAKNLIKKKVKDQAEKIAKESGQEAADKFVEKEIKKELAENPLLQKEVNRYIGQVVGVGQLAGRYGTGEVTTRAVDEAIVGIEDPQQQVEKIQELSTSKLAGLSAAHALADFIGLKIGLGALDGLNKATQSMLLNVAKNVGVTGLKEAPVEAFQSALERYGADLPLADRQAIKEYIDAAAGGFFMPIIPATIGGLRTPKPRTDLTTEETPTDVTPEEQTEQTKVNKEEANAAEDSEDIINSVDDIITGINQEVQEQPQEVITQPEFTFGQNIYGEVEGAPAPQQVIGVEDVKPTVQEQQTDRTSPSVPRVPGERTAGTITGYVPTGVVSSGSVVDTAERGTTLLNATLEDIVNYSVNTVATSPEVFKQRADYKITPALIKKYIKQDFGQERLKEINNELKSKNIDWQDIANNLYKLTHTPSGVVEIRDERNRREAKYNEIMTAEGNLAPINIIRATPFEKSGAIEEAIPMPVERGGLDAARDEAIKDAAYEAAYDEYEIISKSEIDKKVVKKAQEKGIPKEELDDVKYDPLTVLTQDEYNTIVNEAPQIKSKTLLEKFNEKKKVRDTFVKDLNEEETGRYEKLKNEYAGMARRLAKDRASEKVIGQEAINKRKEARQLDDLVKQQEAMRAERKTRKVSVPKLLSDTQIQSQRNNEIKKSNKDLHSFIGKGISLKALLEKSGSNFNETRIGAQKLAELLSKVISKTRVDTTVKLGKVRGDRFAMFNPKTNTITVNSNVDIFTQADANNEEISLDRIIAHETMHALMDHIIDNPDVLPPDLRQELNKLENIYKDVSKQLGKDVLDTFQIDTFKEFVAEVFTNKDVQQLVNTVGPRIKRSQSFLKDLAKFIYTAIRRLTGVDPNKTLVDAVTAIENIITSKEYIPASEEIKGKRISFAPEKKAPEYTERSFDQLVEDNVDKDYEYKNWFTRSYTTLKNLLTGGQTTITQAITTFQNDRYAVKKLQDDLEKAGLLKRFGKGFNNIYDYITLSFGRSDRIMKEILKQPMEAFERTFSEYVNYVADKKGIDKKQAAAELKIFLTAMHEPERRKVKFMKFVPLSTQQVIKLASGQMISPAAMREKIFNVLETKTNMSDAEIQNLRKMLEYLTNPNTVHNGVKTIDATGVSFKGAKYKSTDINNFEYDVTALSEAQQKDIMNRYNALPAEQKQLVDSIKEQMRNLQTATRKVNRDSNYVPPQAENIIKFYAWKDYIPLKGKFENKGENDAAFIINGPRLSGDLKRVDQSFEGGSQDAADPFAQLMVDAATAVARAGRVGLTESIKNAVNQKYIKGKVEKTSFTYKDRYENSDELKKAAAKKNTILNYNADGSIDVIEIKDDALLEGIRRTYREGHPMLDIANGITGFIGQLHTRFNPAFPILNFVRDAITNTYNISAEKGFKQGFKYLNTIANSVVNGGMNDIRKVSFLYVKGGIDAIKKYADEQAKRGNMYPTAAYEYLQEGGNIAYIQGLSVANTMNDLALKLNKSKVLNTKQNITDFFDSVMLTFELGSRVAAYKIAKEEYLANNLSKAKNQAERADIEQAAKQLGAAYAKRLANFEETGRLGQQLGAWFMFFRPAATGAVRALEAIAPFLRSWESVSAAIPKEIRDNPEALAEYRKTFMKQSDAARAVVLSTLGMGATVYAIAAALSGDDDEGRNRTFNDDMSRWTRYARFDIGDGKVIQIPWGFGNGGLAAFGAQMASLFVAKENPASQTIGNVINILMDSYLPLPISRINPLENSDNTAAFILDSFVPSAVRPLYEYSMNMNAFGQQIYNNRQNRVGDAYTGGDNIPDIYKDAALMLLDATNGEVDWGPNTMYFFANNYSDGLSRMIQNFYGLGLTIKGDKQFDPKRDLQVLDSFFAEYSKVDQRAYSRVKQEAERRISKLKALENSPTAYANYLQNNPADLLIEERYNQIVNKDMKQIRTVMNQTRGNRELTPKEKKNQLDALKDMLNIFSRQLVYEVDILLETYE